MLVKSSKENFILDYCNKGESGLCWKQRLEEFYTWVRWGKSADGH